jgi:hypothetical protein
MVSNTGIKEAKQKFYEYGRSIGIKMTDLQYLRSLMNDELNKANEVRDQKCAWCSSSETYKQLQLCKSCLDKADDTPIV